MPFDPDTICLLDDEPSVLRALGRLLVSDGLKVANFGDPASFLEHARRHPLRVAVIDIRMPGMSGLEVLAELHAIAPGTQVIVMSGESDPGHREAALEWGARAYFAKPFDDSAMLSAVRAAMAPIT